MTGLAGTYEIRMEFTPPNRTLSALPTPGSAPDLFTALREQLGLKLESRKGPVTLLVIDSALRQPTEN